MPKTASIILDGKSVLGLSIFFTIDAFKWGTILLVYALPIYSALIYLYYTVF
jgi:hypothetical protein